MTGRRWSAAALLAVAASTSWCALLAAAGPARADDRGSLSIALGEVVEKDYPPIPVPAPPAAISSKPSTCTTSASCDVVHLTVNRPDDIAVSETFVRATLLWKSASGAPQDQGCILYLYDEPEGAAALKSSTCAGGQAGLSITPTKAQYQFVIRNFDGTNNGYTLKLQYINGHADPPIESLEPSPTTPTTVPSSVPVDASAAAPSSAPTASAPNASDVLAGFGLLQSALPGALGADPDLAAFSSNRNLESLLGSVAPPTASAGAPVKTGPISRIALIGFMLAIPSASGAAVVPAWRRRRSRPGAATWGGDGEARSAFVASHPPDEAWFATKAAERPTPIDIARGGPPTSPTGVTSSPSGPPAIPASPAGRQLHWLLDVLARRGAQLTVAEVKEHFSDQIAELIGTNPRAAFEDLALVVGDLHLTRIEEVSPRELLCALQSGDRGWRLPLAVDPDDGGRIVQSPIGPPPFVAPGTAVRSWPAIVAGFPAPQVASTLDRAAIDQIDAAARRIQQEHHTVGVAVGVVQRGALVHFSGHGWADVDEQLPMTPTTGIRLASISKTMTAIAVMQLVEEGRIRLDDPVKAHLRAYRLECAEPKAPPITIRHLLTHRSGLATVRSASHAAAYRAAIPALADYYRPRLVAPRPPGERFEYSNDGFATLGQIVEDVRGKPFIEVMRERVFDPLGMASTDFIRSDRVPRLATGYDRDFDDLYAVPFLDLVVRPAGAACSTVDDMVKYMTAVGHGGAAGGGRVLSAASMAAMFEIQATEPFPIGLSFIIFGDDGHRVAFHNGGWPGINSAMVVGLDEDFAVFTHVNRSPGATVHPADDLCFEVARLLFDVSPAAERDADLRLDERQSTLLAGRPVAAS